MASQTRSHCPNCQTQYEPRARVCAVCGRVRDRQTTEEGTAPPPSFPESAWALAVRRCPWCASERPAIEEYCGNCAKNIPLDAPVTSKPAPGQYPTPRPSYNREWWLLGGMLCLVIGIWCGIIQAQGERVGPTPSLTPAPELLPSPEPQYAPSPTYFAPVHALGGFPSGRGVIHVRSYTRKDGTVVRAHTRRSR
jgi:hypothetical protein